LPVAARAPRAAKLPPRRAWLRIFVVRCGLPCDPPVGGHSCNGGMIPRFECAVCGYFTLGSVAGADCKGQNLKAVTVVPASVVRPQGSRPRYCRWCGSRNGRDGISGRPCRITQV
jgi:hypothetical protein